MRLSVFLFLALVAAFGVGLISILGGAGIWVSFGRAIVALVVLQIAYFLFLVIAARNVSAAKSHENTD